MHTTYAQRVQVVSQSETPPVPGEAYDGVVRHRPCVGGLANPDDPWRWCDVETSEYAETYNPWTVVDLVFNALAQAGLHPVLGEAGDPGVPAAELLLALGIRPAVEGNRQVVRDIREHLATIRTAVLGEP